MLSLKHYGSLLVLSASAITLSACSTYAPTGDMASNTSYSGFSSNYESRMPAQINTREKVVVINPNVHAWGAYDSSGHLVKAGLATAGGNWCSDIGRPCRTRPGSFRVNSLGSAECKSSLYPLPNGGAPMPYCMFFNRNQALHGSYHVVEGNVSHGCVRVQVADAEWLRFNFVNVGTKVVVQPY